jgi:hypothetical protein
MGPHGRTTPIADYEDLRDFDPAILLPFSKELEALDPNTERLPAQYQGTDRGIYGGDSQY